MIPEKMIEKEEMNQTLAEEINKQNQRAMLTEIGYPHLKVETTQIAGDAAETEMNAEVIEEVIATLVKGATAVAGVVTIGIATVTIAIETVTATSTATDAVAAMTNIRGVTHIPVEARNANGTIPPPATKIPVPKENAQNVRHLPKEHLLLLKPKLQLRQEFSSNLQLPKRTKPQNAKCGVRLSNP
eukprot:TRINITY_DN7753_c0_g1_i1.p1 TRINITY_DN7753_c0_g1~~TRINITY_DN7753_c0_g1_i1.p1  ORF type:complete len:186 (-),score=32.97 TRINITY_DN7753_c0_g1_i1:32-589(-)